MTPDELTLASIDSMRHLTTSEEIVKAVAYAARYDNDDRTCYRFVTALGMTDNLTRQDAWFDILHEVNRLEAQARMAEHRRNRQ